MQWSILNKDKTLSLDLYFRQAFQQSTRIKIQTYYEYRRYDTLHSPGWNKGKARNETLGTQGTQKLRAP